MEFHQKVERFRGNPDSTELRRSVDRDSGQRAGHQHGQIADHERRVHIRAYPEAGMDEQDERTANADYDMGESPPIGAAQSRRRPPFPERRRHEPRPAQPEKRISAPLLPQTVEPQKLKEGGAEPVRYGDAGRQQRRRRGQSAHNGEGQQQFSETCRPGS